MRKTIIFVFIFVFLLARIFVLMADEISDIEKQINLLKKNLAEKETDQKKTIDQLNNIKKRLGVLENEIKKKEQEVKEGEKALDYQQKLLNERAKSYYKNINKNTINLTRIFMGENLVVSIHDFFYQKFLVEEDKRAIIKIVLYIKKLEETKANLNQEKTRLSLLKTEVDNQLKLLTKEISQTRERIAVLSARQQELIAQKLAQLNIPKSAGSRAPACVDDRDRDPGFSPRLAFYTYGVPNRVGLNQYGAYGRAKTGQNEEEILRAYYDNFELKKDYDTGINITVEGYGVYNIEDYVKRIYEVPDRWGVDGYAALKAQAIAARSYALAYTNNGANPICPTERCQVFKPEPKGGYWEQAVNDTRGWVMVQDGRPIKAWYSSTHGGYVFNSGQIGWSATSWTKSLIDAPTAINNFSDLQNNAYDRDSPWFYCDWGSRPEYNKTAWLKPQEVADIVNTILLAKKDPSVGEHLYQTDRPNPAGTDTWDQEKVKTELRNRGMNPYNTVYDVSVSVDFGVGRVISVNISGDAGNTSFDGKEFKDWFNLRAPANIQIIGPLFNVEKQ